MLRRIALIATTCLIASAVAVRAEMPAGVSHTTLQNGLEVVVIEDPRTPVVVQMLWYKIGSADEAPGKSGIAHYLEHLMFKGTDKLEPGEFSKTVTANGGMDNAFTSYDFTTYFQRIASDRLPLVMEMEADRMANLQIGDDDWQAERQVVLEERAQRIDSNPSALFSEERNAVLFDNHPYGQPVIGWRAEMMELTREDAVAWYDAHYAPDKAVLILAGDLSAEEGQALAEKFYGPIPAKGEAEPRTRPQEPQHNAPRRMEMRDPRVAQPQFIRTYLAPERNPGAQKEAAAMKVLAELIGGSMQTSLLGRKLAMTGKVVWIDVSYSPLSLDQSTLSLAMVPAPGTNPQDAEKLLDDTLAAFLETGTDPADLERVKTQIRATEIYAQDSAHGRAYEYGQALATGLTVDDVNAWPDILSAVTEQDVMAAAGKLLSSKATVSGWLLPEAPEPANPVGPKKKPAKTPPPSDSSAPQPDQSKSPQPRPEGLKTKVQQ